MYAIKSPAVGDELYRPTVSETEALYKAIQHVIENGADAEVRDEQDKLIWHCEADTPVSSDPPSVQPVIVTNWR